TVNNVLLDIYGGSTGKRVFHGEMIDISKGGLSFTIRISKKESTHLLLGRQIVSEITHKGRQVLECLGLIMGVTRQHEMLKEYSVHIKFYQELKQHQVNDVLNLVL
ncbi:MAG TPA: PilZ domain-containing protein, partial [Desulfopila sp.]|nr:PilZ domain-containing protein [Desulfopila sp.]